MYVEGFVTPVPKANKEIYIKHVQDAAELFKDIGVSRMVECWNDDVNEGKVTDFFKAVQAKPDEAVLFSWFEWPSKEVRDAGVKKMMEDPRFERMGMPFDAKRMIFGGFKPIFDQKF